MAIAAGRDTTRGFENFVRTEYPAVYRAVFLATGRPQVAEDATQEAFERAFVRWRRLSKQDWAGGWVMTTALNAAKRALRKRPATTDNRRHASPPSTASLDLSAALKLLPRRQQQAMLLFYIGDLSLAAVANVMGVSEGTIKAHLAQARASLREALGDDYVR